jgi:hypothetical protein
MRERHDRLPGAILVVLLLASGCPRNAPEPSAQRSAPREQDANAPRAPTTAAPGPAPTSGVVEGVPWTFVAGQPDRLIFGSGASAVTITLHREAGGCFSSDRIHGTCAGSRTWRGS